MKKIIIVLLSAAMLVSLCSCNSDKDTGSSTTTTTAPAVKEELLEKEELLAEIKENAPGMYDYMIAIGSVPHTISYSIVDPKTFEELYVSTYTIDENYDCVNIYEMNNQIDREIWLGKTYYYSADDKKAYTKSESTDEEYAKDIAQLKESYNKTGFFKESFKITKGTAELNGKPYSTDTLSDSRISLTAFYDESGKLEYLKNTTGELRKILFLNLEADKSLFDIPDDFRLVTAEEMDEILSDD